MVRDELRSRSHADLYCKVKCWGNFTVGHPGLCNIVYINIFVEAAFAHQLSSVQTVYRLTQAELTERPRMQLVASDGAFALLLGCGLSRVMRSGRNQRGADTAAVFRQLQRHLPVHDTQRSTTG